MSTNETFLTSLGVCLVRYFFPPATLPNCCTHGYSVSVFRQRPCAETCTILIDIFSGPPVLLSMTL